MSNKILGKQVGLETLLGLFEKIKLETDMEQWTGCKLGKEYVKAVYCHPDYLTYMQSISGVMPGWVKHKLESTLPGEISIISDLHMYYPYD